MRKIFDNRWSKILLCFMIIVQGFLFSLVATFYMDKVYIKKLSSFPESSLYIELKTIPDDKASATLHFLQNFSKKNGVAYIKGESELDKNGHVIGVTFAVDGDLSRNKDFLKFDFLGQTVVDFDKLQELLDSTNEDSTIGISESSLNSIGNIPKFKFGNNIVFKKLEKVVNDAKSINGEYRIVGLDKSKEKEFINGLSEASGVDSKVFFDNKTGYTHDSSFKEIILVGIFGVHSVVLLALSVVITVKHLQNLGKLMLQGWSRFHFAISLYRPMIYTGIISVFLFVPYGMFLTTMTFNSLIFYSLMLALGMLHFIIVLSILSIASIFIFMISPIGAIRERFPKKAYLFVSCLVYVVFNLLLIGVCCYIDGPYKEIEGNVEISKRWEQVSNYKILWKIGVGEDKASFNRQSKELNRDIYNWYSSISESDGVSIVNTSYISDDILKSYRLNGVYKDVPKEAFWSFTVSPDYLSKVGVDISEDIVRMARSGVRVYLIPENKSEEEQTLLRNMIEEKDTKSIRSDDIETVFSEKKRVQVHNI